jgi:hypothetical protein
MARVFAHQVWLWVAWSWFMKFAFD